MNESHINKELYNFFINYDYKLFNAFVFNWESDFFAISKTGYSIEVEIKITKADFKHDYTKTLSTWMRGSTTENKHEFLLSENNRKSNKFAFACPEGMINIEDIDEKYGLYWISKYGVKIIREPKFLHKEKILDDKYFIRRLLDRFYFRNIKLRASMRLRECDLKYGQERINIF